MLATPAYGGVTSAFAFALAESVKALASAGIDCEVAIFAGDCHVDDARNRIVRDFLEGSCTDLVFLDADLRWEPQSLIDLCQFDVDVVGASYPFKQDEGGFPVQWLDGEIWADENGLVEVKGLPTGFLRIRRHVLEALALRSSKFKPKSDARGDIPLIFERAVGAGRTRIGGDYGFCDKWRFLGGKIHCAPEIFLEHVGERAWAGSLGHYQRVQMHGRIGAGLFEIRNGIETTETFNDLVDAWGNEWSVGPAFLSAVVALARRSGGPVLECGSGLSSLVLAASGADLHVLEHDRKWSELVLQAAAKHRLLLHMHTAPLRDGWYQRPHGWPSDWGLVICDGPPRHVGNRAHVFDLMRLPAPLVLDDAEGPELVALNAWADSTGRKVEILGQTKRKFAIAA